MSGRYAQQTTVSVYQGRAEIEQILSRYKADQYAYMTDGDTAAVAFRLQGRFYKMVLPLPNRNEKRFTHHSRGLRTPDAAEKEWEQACRSRWRALCLVIKAKLEAVECGISTIEREFLPNVVMPDGRQFHEWAEPDIQQMYVTGRVPSILMLESKKAG